MGKARIVIGTAGHVDHGKTSLVHALTGVDTDRLAEEKRRGISIELGFAPWRLADDLEATVVDVPGHRRFMRAMIAGASGVQLALLVIATNEGVMPQTREHARACFELGIRRFVVALTKRELVDDETQELAEAEARELLAALGRDGDAAVVVDVVACSAKTGAGLTSLQNALIAAARDLGALAATAAAARLWVDRVFTMPGAGTIVTGTLVAGAIAVGDELLVSGSGREQRAVARGLRIHNANVERADATTRLAINLTIAAKDVARGDLVTSDLALRSTRAIDAVFFGAELAKGSVVMLHLGTTHVTVRVGRVLRATPEGAQLVTLSLSAPRPIAGGDRFLLRGGATASRDGALLGGGTVLDARPPPPRRLRGEGRWALGRALLHDDAPRALRALLAEAAPRSVSLRPLHGRLATDPAALDRAMREGVKDGSLAACGEGVVEQATLEAFIERVRALVLDHAREALARGMPVATLRQVIAADAGDDLAELAIAAACARAPKGDGEAIRIDGDVVVPVGHDQRRDAALGPLTKSVEDALAEAGVHGLSDFRVAEIAGRDRAKAVLALLAGDGRAVHAGDLWFAGDLVVDLRSRVVAHLQSAAKLTVAELKTIGAVPRKQAVLLLEHFDRERVTRRMGEVRVLFSAPAGRRDA